MKKNLKILALSASVLVCGALTFTLPSEKFQKPVKKTMQTDGLFTQNNKAEVATMKPAWYQYFNLQKTDKVNLSDTKIQFIKTGEQADNLLIFKVINTSAQDLHLKTQDGSLIMIQEAKNQKDEWQPIEYWNFDWGMGASFDELNLPSKHSIITTAPKYEGNFNTQVRFKLQINEKELIYSESFPAKISLGQFKINPQSIKKSISYLEIKQ